MTDAKTKGPLDPADTFHIAFDTKSMPGKLVVTTVALRREILDMGAEGFDERVFRIDLANHPLYRELQRYIDGNRRG